MRRPAARVPYLAGIARLAGGPGLRPPRQLFSDSAYDPSPGAHADQGTRRAAGLAPAASSAATPEQVTNIPQAPAGATAPAPPIGPATALQPRAPAIDAPGAAPAPASTAPGTGPAATAVPREPGSALAPPVIRTSTRQVGAQAAPAPAAPVPLPLAPAGPVATWFDPRWSEPVALQPVRDAGNPTAGAPIDVPATNVTTTPRAEASTSERAPLPHVGSEALPPVPRPADAAPTDAPRPAPEIPRVRPQAAEIALVPVPILAPQAAGTEGEPLRAAGGRVVIGSIEVTVVPPPPPAPERRPPVAPPPTAYVRPASLIAGSPGATQLRSGSRRWYGTAQS